MSFVRIVHSCTDFVVAAKPAGIHSAPLHSQDEECALKEVAELYPEVLEVRGKKSVEGGLVHRIDFDTAGLLLFALSQDFYSHIMACQEQGRFQKGYAARCQRDENCPGILGGFPPAPLAFDLDDKFGFSRSADAVHCFTVESGFRPFGPGRRQVRPVTGRAGKFSRKKACGKKQGSEPTLEHTYSTQFSIRQINEKTFAVQATLAKGYRHQVRCHLAWCGLPIVGDPLYDPASKSPLEIPGTIPGPEQAVRNVPCQMRFFATSLSFPALCSNQILTFELSQESLKD